MWKSYEIENVFVFYFHSQLFFYFVILSSGVGFGMIALTGKGLHLLLYAAILDLVLGNE